MLARLDEIPGVSRSRAECSGHYSLVELTDGVTAGVAARVAERRAQWLDPGRMRSLASAPSGHFAPKRLGRSAERLGIVAPVRGRGNLVVG